MDLHDNAERALRMVREAEDIVYDTETTGLDWKVNHVVGYVIGAEQSPGRITQEDVVYVPVRHGGGGNLPGAPPMTSPTEGFRLHPFEEALQKAFLVRRERSTGRVIGHHTKFDVHMSANSGVYLGRRLACTQNQAAMLDEYAHSFSLDTCSKEAGVTVKLGDELYAHMARLLGGKPERKIMEHFWKLPGNDPLAYDYSVGDGVSTMELYRWQQKKIAEEEMTVVAELENDLIWTLFRSERKGIKVDIDQIQQLREATELKVAAILRKFPLGFNVRSPKQVQQVFDDAGVKDYPYTEPTKNAPNGNPSFTEKWLKQKGGEIGRDIIEIRQARNLIASFIDPLEKTHMFKGRVHATLNQLKSDDSGTISGRFSCSDPNLQQVPKRVKELAKPFRRLFIADEEHVFWERDYSQCEPRLFAHYSQDENLLRGYNSVPFVDAHAVVAELLNVERDPTAKRMNMGIFTGMQTKAFADHMGWDFQRASDAWHMWFRKFPGVKRFQDNAKARLQNRGFVYTLLGRRCRLEHARFAYRGTSKIIQGGNADIIKYKYLQVDRMCEDSGDIVQILMTVHDSFNGQFQNTPEGFAMMTEIEAVLRDVQGPPFNLTVPFEVDGHNGPNWAIATFGEDKPK